MRESIVPHDVHWIYFGPKIFGADGWVRDNFRANMTDWLHHNPRANFTLWIDQRKLSKSQLDVLSAFIETLRQINPALVVKDHTQIVARLPESADPSSDVAKIYRLFLAELNNPNGNYGAASDLFRLLVLANKGGIYADLDVHCQYPLQDTVKAPHGILIFFSKLNMTQEGNIRGAMSNCVVAVPPRVVTSGDVIHELMAKIVRNYDAGIQKYGSLEQFFHKRGNFFSIMNTSGSDAYRDVLFARVPHLHSPIKGESHFFYGPACYQVDFFTQSLDATTAFQFAKQADDVEGALSQRANNGEEIRSPRLLESDTIDALLTSPFEKTWVKTGSASESAFFTVLPEPPAKASALEEESADPKLKKVNVNSKRPHPNPLPQAGEGVFLLSSLSLWERVRVRVQIFILQLPMNGCSARLNQ